MARVFVTQPVAESALARLRTMAEVTVNPDGSRVIAKDRLIAGARACDILFSLLHDPVDREVIAANPSLRAIASMSITPDNIDVAAATARRIPVTVVPALAVESTADIHFALLLAVARRLVEGDHAVRAGIFPGSQSNHLLGAGVHGKTIGLIGGRGRIGQAVAARARGFSMRILYCGPRPMEEADETRLGAEYVPLDRLLAEADFVSLHPRLTAATRHLIGPRELSLMKPTAYLVNTSRAPIIDQAALLAALKGRKIAGAAIDVYDVEPVTRCHPLFELDNVIVTPHLGYAIEENMRINYQSAVENIRAFLAGKPIRLVKPRT
jgi:glyoxylate reductase